MRLLTFILNFLGFVKTFEYFGVLVGNIETTDIQANVYFVNTTHLQINKFQSSTSDLSDTPFAVVNDRGKKTYVEIYEYKKPKNEEEWLKRLEKVDTTRQINRFVLKMPGSAAQWTSFAIINKKGAITASLNFGSAQPPKPFCCFTKPEESELGLFGEYGIISDPIEVLDSKTLKIVNFSYKGSQTPDGYFFTGTGPEINQTSGQKAIIVGVNSANNVCPMLEDITNQDMVIRLPSDQSIYTIEWLSVFCYKYSHDFGHLDLGLIEDEEPIPAFVPEVLESEPAKRVHKSC